MAEGFIGARVGAAVTSGADGGLFTAEDNYYLNTLGPNLNVPFQATGGTKSTTARGGWVTHVYTGTDSFVVSSGSAAVEYLVVAGGGAGGGSPNIPGGGGAGGYRQAVPGSTTGGGGSADPVITFNPGTYPVSVGGGAAIDSPNPADTRKGSPSYIGPAPAKTVESIGGGGGGDYAQQGGDGGSGGGSGQNGPQSGGAAVSPTYPTPYVTQGFAGGKDPNVNPGEAGVASEAGGGGGGAASVGQNSFHGPYTGGYGGGGGGGEGHTSTIDGSPVKRGGGGGAGSHPAPSGTYSGEGSPTTAGGSGPGGGGRGGYTGTGTGATAGTVNTGGGGGGNYSPTPGSPQGAAGGSGYVVIAYPQDVV